MHLFITESYLLWNRILETSWKLTGGNHVSMFFGLFKWCNLFIMVNCLFWNRVLQGSWKRDGCNHSNFFPCRKQLSSKGISRHVHCPGPESVNVWIQVIIWIHARFTSFSLYNLQGSILLQLRQRICNLGYTFSCAVKKAFQKDPEASTAQQIQDNASNK